MPVKSSGSTVFVWPDAAMMRAAARTWAVAQRELHPELVRLGVFGSYARGEAGVGSDLDLVAVVSASDEPFMRRAARRDVTTLPVPVDLLVYTAAEWAAMQARGGGLAGTLALETEWVVG